MITDVITVPHTASYRDAATLFHEHSISGAPVVDDSGSVVGVLSEKDLFRVLYPYYSSYHEHPEMYTDFEKREEKVKEIHHKGIGDYVSREVVSCEPDTPIMKVGGQMIAQKVHRVIVMESGELVGIVTRRDIYNSVLREHLSLEV